MVNWLYVSFINVVYKYSKLFLTIFQDDEILSRLVFESISLATHLVWQNIRSDRPLMQYILANTTTETESLSNSQQLNGYKSSASTSNDTKAPNYSGSLFLSSLSMAQKSYPRMDSKKKSKLEPNKGSKISAENNQPNEISNLVTNPGDSSANTNSFLSSQSPAEREKLYFQLKNFEARSDQREVKKELENLILSQLRANTLPYDKSLSLPHWVTTLRESTMFQGWQGPSIVAASGVRQYRFLLLDWNPENGLLKSVAEVTDDVYWQVGIYEFT